VTPGSKRNLAIVAGVALVVVAVITARDDDPAQPAGIQVRGGQAPAGAARATATMPVADVKLELLQQKRPEREAADRNLFRFQARPAPAASAQPRAVAAPPTPVAPPPPSVPSGPPPPPPIGLRYIGLVDAPSQAGRIAILSDGRGNIFYGKDGDIIEGRYKVLKVSPDAAELAYLDGRGRQTIRLTGQ
jgi:hypothetical protein